MRIFLAFLVAEFVWLLTLTAHTVADEFIADAPDWAAGAPVYERNEARLDQVTAGLYFLLLDRQVRWTREEETSFRRVAYEITDRSGLEEGARILWTFDPSHESVKFHSIAVVRDGVRSDRLQSTAIRSYRREEELNQGIVDGHLTLHADLTDIRVGDTIEYELSTVSKPQLDLGQLDLRFYLAWETPIAVQRYRVLVPDGVELNIRNYDVENEPARWTENGMSVLEWTARDLEPVPFEADQPDWNISGAVMMSNTQSWREVSRLLAPHYLGRQDLPEEFVARVDEIAQNHSGVPDRVTEALRLIQDSIRYVGNEIGPGAYVPRSPANTVRNGYGDCKDKTLLLIAALARLGIDAVPALVHLTKGHGLEERLPSLFSFNHVIARVEVNGETFWLDPTISHQGGRIPDIATPDYGHALQISGTGADLEPIPVPAPETPGVRVEETVTFPRETSHVEFDVLTRYTAARADDFRWRLKNSSRSQLERDYLNYYEKQFPGLEPAGELLVEDDRDANVITIQEHYMLSLEALHKDDFGKTFPLRGYTVNVLTELAARGRTQPAKLSYPVFREHEIKLFGLPARYLPLDDVVEDNDYFRFRMHSKAEGFSLQVFWQIQTKRRMIEAGDVAQHATNVNKVTNNLSWTYDFQSETEAIEEVRSVFNKGIFVMVLLGLLALPVLIFGWTRRTSHSDDTGIAPPD